MPWSGSPLQLVSVRFSELLLAFFGQWFGAQRPARVCLQDGLAAGRLWLRLVSVCACLLRQSVFGFEHGADEAMCLCLDGLAQTLTLSPWPGQERKGAPRALCEAWLTSACAGFDLHPDEVDCAFQALLQVRPCHRPGLQLCGALQSNLFTYSTQSSCYK